MIDNSKEYILCAAVKRREGGFDCGYRHNDVYEKVPKEKMAEVYRTDFFYDMGFLTSKERFVDRYEAYQIAVACGQIEERKFEPDPMFPTVKEKDLHFLASEDLY